MRIVILLSAIEDIARGRDFYERQGEGLGDYFEESLTADIDSLTLTFRMTRAKPRRIRSNKS